MYAIISSNQWMSVPLESIAQLPNSSIIACPTVQRIKEYIVNFFLKFRSTFTHDAQSKDLNLLPIAMISCLSLILILFISMLRKPNDRFVAPPTPMKKMLKNPSRLSK